MALIPIAPVYLANAGIPFFTQSVFYQVLLFVPIVAIESLVHQKLLGVGIPRSLWISLVTNIFSTVVGGVFLLFFGASLGQVLRGNSVPVQPGDFPFLPLEIMVTLIPAFFLSFFIEASLASLRLKDLEKPKIKHSFFIANAFTYGMLEVLAIVQLIKGYLEGRGTFP